MPLVYQQNINACTKIGVWKIEEDESYFLSQVPLQNFITHPQKRLQHLAGRMLLKLLFPDFPLDLIRIADTRKPFLEEEQFHFSISHCGNYAAAIVSTKNRVGIDIEWPRMMIERIRHKFLSPGEEQLLSGTGLSPTEYLTLGWSTKESIFKWYGAGEMDFKEHMVMETVGITEDKFQISCEMKKNETVLLRLEGIRIDENFLMWVVT